MIILLGKDPWTLVSLFGLTLMSVTNWISTHVNPVIAALTGAAAMILAVLGIIEKWLIIKQKLSERKTNPHGKKR